jgi:IS30 family transposase
MIDLLQPDANRMYTLTADNNRGFAVHEKIARELKSDFFFTQPYADLEWGSNENMNGVR